MCTSPPQASCNASDKSQARNEGQEGERFLSFYLGGSVEHVVCERLRLSGRDTQAFPRIL
jgi:hypothetical protein